MKHVALAVFAMAVAAAAQPVYTRISDTLPPAVSGQAVNGTISISWSEFTYDSATVAQSPASGYSYPVVAGNLSIQLAATDHAGGQSVVYRVVTSIGGNPTTTYWKVPTLPSAQCLSSSSCTVKEVTVGLPDGPSIIINPTQISTLGSTPGQVLGNVAGEVGYMPAASGLADPGGNGIVARTALNTTAPRTLGATSPITIANPDGTGGNPLYACPTCAVTGNPLSQFGATTSAQLAGILSDETGSGLAVFNNSPTLITPALGTPSSIDLSNATALPCAALPALTGDVGGSGCSTTLANTAVTPGSYTSANINVDAKGRITGATNGSGGASPVGGAGAVQGYATSTTLTGDNTKFAFNFTPLTPPGSPPVITHSGTAGTTTWGYKTCLFSASGCSLSSSEGTTTTGNATLTGVNFNIVSSPTCPSAVTQFGVYRSTGNGSQLAGYLGSQTCGISYNDTGQPQGGSESEQSTGVYSQGLVTSGNTYSAYFTNPLVTSGDVSFGIPIAPSSFILFAPSDPSGGASVTSSIGVNAAALAFVGSHLSTVPYASNGFNSIVTFFAGVGSAANDPAVLPFREPAFVFTDTAGGGSGLQLVGDGNGQMLGGININIPLGFWHVVGTLSGTPVGIEQAAPGQTADLHQWRASDGTMVLSRVLAGGGVQFPTVNYVATENGANNAIACAAASGPTLTPGLSISLLLAHSLQAGANTLAYNGGSALPIKSHRNPASDIGSAYASGAIVTLQYDGTQWQDLSQ